MTSLFSFGASTSAFTSTSTSTSINKNNKNNTKQQQQQQQQQPASAVAAVDVAATMVTKNDFDVSTKIVADNCCINDSNVVGGSFSNNKIGTTEICTPTGSSTSDDASVVVNTKSKTSSISEESTIEKSTPMKTDPAAAAADAADAITDSVATHTKKKEMMIKKKHKKTKKLTPCSVIRSMHQNYIQRVQEEQVDTLLQFCTSASEVVSAMIAIMNPKKEDEVVVGKMNITASSSSTTTTTTTTTTAKSMMIQKEYDTIYKQIQIVVQKNPDIVHGIDPITGYNALHILVGTTYSDIGYHYKLIQLLIQTSRKVSLRQQQQQQQQQLLLAASSSMSRKTKKNIKMMNNTKRNSSSFTDNYNNDNNKEDGDGDAFDNENDTDFDETMTMMTTSTTTNTVGGGCGGSGYGNGNGGDHSNSSSSFGHPLLVSNSSTGTLFAAKDMIIPKLLLQPSIRGESVLHVACSNPYIGYNPSNIISTTISAAGISTTGTGTIFDVLEYLLQYNPALASMTDAFHQNLPLHTLCTTVASSASLSTSKSSTTLSTILSTLSSIGNKTNGSPGVTTQTPSLPKNNNNSSSSSSSSSIVVPPIEILLLLVQHYPSACSIPNSDGDLPLHLLANITCTETIIPRTRKISVIVDSKRTSTTTAATAGAGAGGGKPGHTDYDDDDDDEIDSLQDLHLLDLDDEDDDDDDDEDDDDVDSFCNDDAEEHKKNNYKNTKNYKNDNNDKNDNSNSKNNSNSTSRHRKYTQQVVLPSDIIMSDKERIELERTEQIRYEKQLEWIQYLVHVYPDALSVRNDTGLTPLQVALTSSTKYKQLLMKQQKICTMKKKYQPPDYNPNDHHGYHNDDHCNKDHNDDENYHDDDDDDDDDSSEDSDASYLWDPIIHFLSDPIGFKNMEQQQQQQQQQHHPHHPHHHHHDHHHHNQDVHDVLGASSNHHSYSTLNNSNTALDINHNSIRWDHHDHSNDPCRIGATGTGIGISSGRTGFVVGDVSGREVDDELLKIAPNPWHPDHYAINANGSNNNINNRSNSNNNNNSTKTNNNRPLLRCSDHGVRGGRGGQFLSKQQSFKKQISDRKLMMMSDDYDDPLTKALQALEDASERGYHYSDMSGNRNNNRSNNYNNSFNHNKQNNNHNNNIDINMFSIDDDVSESLSAFASPSQNGRRKIAKQQQRQLFRQQPYNPSNSTNSYNNSTTDEDHYIHNNPPQTPNPIGSTSSNNKNGSKTPSSRSRHGSMKTNSISNNKNIDAQFEYPKDILSFSPSSSSVEGKKITSSTSNEIVGIMKSINMKSKSNTSAGDDDGERDLIVGRRRSSSNSPKKIPSSAVASTETAHTMLPSRKNNTDSYGYNKNSHPQNQKYHYHHHPHNDVDAGIVKKPPPFFVNERNGLIDFSESNQSVSEHDIYND